MAATLCTYSLPSHAPHAPLTPLPFHFHSAAEFLRIQHALHTEKEKLAHTIRLAELCSCSMSQKNATAIEEEKRLLALVKTCTLGRQRWITAINKVLHQNCAKHVKVRLLNSKYAGWYKALVEAKRRSLHHSNISKLQLMRQDSASCAAAHAAASPMPPGISFSKHIDLRCAGAICPTCPTIPHQHMDPMERRRQVKAERERDSKLGTLSKANSTSLQPLKPLKAITKTPKTPTLLKSSSLVQRLRTKTATSAAALQRFRTSNETSASDIQRILAPHLFLSTQIPESTTVEPELSPVKSPKFWMPKLPCT
jgi:hypothetical protein